MHERLLFAGSFAISKTALDPCPGKFYKKSSISNIIVNFIHDIRFNKYRTYLPAPKGKLSTTSNAVESCNRLADPHFADISLYWHILAKVNGS